ncbi:MAG TPA: hypothetical protein DHV36_16595 [Desulfobacteraceae bacterium]|nr:hypothetical protein [Desulfobacteraceae bacterium]
MTGQRGHGDRKKSELLTGIQALTGFTDEEMAEYIAQPRTGKILGKLEALSGLSVSFEVKMAKGCVVGHKPGDTYVFPGAGAMNLKDSSGHLCPFLMPPMTRIMWLIQERVWEGIEPLPLYAVGHCDDVGLDCGGWGRVVVEARIIESGQ